MKGIIQNIIRKRNENFQFDESIDNRMIFAFLKKIIFDLVRGLKAIFFFKNPKRAMFGSGVKLQYAHKISWGKYLKLGDHVRLSGLGREGIKLGNKVSIGSFSQLIVSTTFDNLGESIIIEDNVGMGEFAYIGGAGGVRIGKNSIIGQYLSMHPENHIYADTRAEIRKQGVVRKGINVGENCWIGSKVTILDGVNIGPHSIIAAGAVVTKSFPPYSIIGGVPAKLLKSRKEDKELILS